MEVFFLNLWKVRDIFYISTVRAPLKTAAILRPLPFYVRIIYHFKNKFCYNSLSRTTSLIISKLAYVIFFLIHLDYLEGKWDSRAIFCDWHSSFANALLTLVASNSLSLMWLKCQKKHTKYNLHSMFYAKMKLESSFRKLA